MPKFTISYSIKLWGEMVIEADTQQEACDELHDLSDADWVEFVALGSGDRNIHGIEREPSPLEQLADTAEG